MGRGFVDGASPAHMKGKARRCSLRVMPHRQGSQGYFENVMHCRLIAAYLKTARPFNLASIPLHSLSVHKPIF